MTPTDALARLRELEAKATPGPWRARFSEVNEIEYEGIEAITTVARIPVCRSVFICETDSDRFIVALRNAAPALLDLWEAAKEVFKQSSVAEVIPEGTELDMNDMNEPIGQLRAALYRLEGEE